MINDTFVLSKIRKAVIARIIFIWDYAKSCLIVFNEKITP